MSLISHVFISNYYLNLFTRFAFVLNLLKKMYFLVFFLIATLDNVYFKTNINV